MIHSLYCLAKLEPQQLEIFPKLKPFIVSGRQVIGKKVLLRLFEAMEKNICPSYPLKIAIIPKVTSRDSSSFNVTSQVEALLAIAPSTLLQSSAGADKDFAVLKDIVSKTTAYRLQLGRDSSSIPRLIKEMLAKTD
jgi:hypothetical protein